MVDNGFNKVKLKVNREQVCECGGIVIRYWLIVNREGKRCDRLLGPEHDVAVVEPPVGVSGKYSDAIAQKILGILKVLQVKPRFQETFVVKSFGDRDKRQIPRIFFNKPFENIADVGLVQNIKTYCTVRVHPVIF